MSLSVGTKLGPYQIEAQIGAGGMGEVYRAKDTRLDRAGLTARPPLLRVQVNFGTLAKPRAAGTG